MPTYKVTGKRTEYIREYIEAANPHEAVRVFYGRGNGFTAIEVETETDELAVFGQCEHCDCYIIEGDEHHTDSEGCVYCDACWDTIPGGGA